MYYSYQQPPPEESIYNLIREDPPPPPQQKRYVSKYPHDTPPTASTFGTSASSQIMTTNLAGDYHALPRNHRHVKAAATFGQKQPHYSDPTSYLTKGNKPPLPEPRRFERTDGGERTKKPAIPTVDSLPNITKKPPKNYIQTNALAAITQAPGKRPQEPERFTNKASYGQVPKYLSSVKKEIQAEKEYIAAAMDQERAQYEIGQPKMRLLPDEERLRLLENLKDKWESVNKQYQGMTHSVVLDTIGKVRRKEEYESQLQSLEKSIEKLSKKFVFVQDGETMGGFY